LIHLRDHPLPHLRKQAEQQQDSALHTATSNGTGSNATTDSAITPGTPNANAVNKSTVSSTAAANATVGDALELEQTQLVRTHRHYHAGMTYHLACFRDQLELYAFLCW
jgi:hypothetical protein